MFKKKLFRKGQLLIVTTLIYNNYGSDFKKGCIVKADFGAAMSDGKTSISTSDGDSISWAKVKDLRPLTPAEEPVAKKLWRKGKTQYSRAYIN
jgi:hypothetical protein